MQEIFEFLQWFRRCFETNYISRSYDPVSRRGGFEPDFTILDKGPTKSCTAGINSSQILSASKIMRPASRRMPGRDSSYDSRGQCDSARKNVENTPRIQEESELTTWKYRQSQLVELYKAEKGFYFAKLRDIDHFIDKFDKESVEELKKGVKDIMFALPENPIRVELTDNISSTKNEMEIN